MNQVSNPFDIINPPASQLALDIMPSKIFLIFLSLVLVTLAFSFFRDLIQKFFNSFFNQNDLIGLIKEIRSSGYLTLLPLVLIGIYNCSIFLVLGLEFSIIYSLLFISVFVFLKIILIQIIGKIFPIQIPTQNYTIVLLVYLIALGVLLTPINLLLAVSYLPKIYTLIAGAVLISSVTVIGFIRSFIINIKWISTNKFHFLLYICTVEFAPFLVIYKFFLV